MAITITGDTGGPIISTSFVFAGGTTGLTFNGAGITETLAFAGITANGGTVSLATDATTSSINIGTGSGIKTVTFGSTFAGSTTTLQAPSGGMTMLGIEGVAVSNKNYVTVDTLTGQIGSDSGSISSVTITGDTGGPITDSSFVFDGGTTGLSFNGVADTFTLAFAGITANGGTVSLATDATASTVNIGTGAGNKTVTLGSTNTTSTTNLQSGSGGIKIPAFAEGALVTDSAGKISTVTGTAGYVLTANAPGTAPSFQAVPGGGGSGSLVLIQSQAASTSANISFTSGITGYSYYYIEVLGALSSTNNTDLQMLFSTDGGASYAGGTFYRYFATNTASNSNSFAGFNNNGTSSFTLSPNTSSNSIYPFNGTMQLFGIGLNVPKIIWSFEATNASGFEQQNMGVGYFSYSTSPVNAIRFQFSSGNISIGTFRLFGVV